MFSAFCGFFFYEWFRLGRGAVEQSEHKRVTLTDPHMRDARAGGLLTREEWWSHPPPQAAHTLGPYTGPLHWVHTLGPYTGFSTAPYSHIQAHTVTQMTMRMTVTWLWLVTYEFNVGNGDEWWSNVTLHWCKVAQVLPLMMNIDD